MNPDRCTIDITVKGRPAQSLLFTSFTLSPSLCVSIYLYACTTLHKVLYVEKQGISFAISLLPVILTLPTIKLICYILAYTRCVPHNILVANMSYAACTTS